MLKRCSSLILALVIGGSVLAGTVRPSDDHVCKMAGMEMMTAMQIPPASPSLSHSHEMMAGGEMPPASPSLSHSHEMMAGGEMMPGMHMLTASSSLGHSHEMTPGLEMMPGLKTMPCCMKDRAQSVSSESGSQGQCCVNIPQETGSSGTKFSLRPPAFSIAVNHPATVHPTMTAPKPYKWFYSTEVFLPNLQSSYLLNLSFLI
jgi:hypothetical protein